MAKNRSSAYPCHICAVQLLTQQPLSFLLLSLVAYFTGIDFLDLTPEGSLLSQCFLTELHPAFTSFPLFLVKYVR
jgi:hypothetical protein